MTLKLRLIPFLLLALIADVFGQQTATFSYTGSAQTWTVPPCVTSITVDVRGAKGGGGTGGNGARVQATLAVTPGQVLQINVGGQGACPGSGWNGGGTGTTANSGANASCGGGGASDIRITPYALGNRLIVAAGGGGQGGGTQDAQGGVGGCATGTAGTSPFGQGGGAASQSNGGAGGPPWISSGNSGTSGSSGQGGNGGTDPCYNNSPGGGGGGGYFGGGGGGSDCYAIAPYGGGSGGGGSSLTPTGGSCSAGTQTGNGQITITYTVGNALADFSATTVCQGNPTVFTDLSSATTTSWTWDFGDGTATSTVQNPSHTYATAGTYNVTLAIVTPNCNTQITYPVTVSAIPSASFTAQPVCEGSATSFTDNSTVSSGTISTWSWDFDGQGNSAQQSPTFTFSNAGTFAVSLTVTSSGGCSASVTSNVSVNPLPTANAGSDVAVCDGNPATLNGSGAANYSWTPTTGLSNANVANPQATPTNTTIYTLTVTNVSGCSDSDDVTVSVNSLPTVNAGLDNSFCDGGSLTLSATGATTYSWNPSTDLSNANIFNPTFNGSQTTTLTVTGTDANGCQNTDDVTITVFPLPIADFAPPADVCLGNSTVFTDNSVGAGLTYSWDFADGSALNTNQNPTHTYALDGTYAVTLEVTDANGCQASTTADAIIYPLPVADAGGDVSICIGDATTLAGAGGSGFSWSPTSDLSNANIAAPLASPAATTTYTLTVTYPSGCSDSDQMTITVNALPVIDAGLDDSMCNGTSVQLGASGGNTYSWSPSADLDDANIGSPTFSGSTTTTLTVIGTDANGCQNTDDVTITVFTLPIADFPVPSDECLGNQTQFTDASTGTGLSYSWNFGDGSAADLTQNPTHTYATDGNFNVSLSVTDANGCQDATSQQATVLPLPNAAMNITDGSQFCELEDIQFMNMSTGGISSVHWNFGNNWALPAFPNTTSTQSDPTFAYPNFAFSPFTVTLSVTDAAGCFDQTSIQVVIHDNPVSDFDFSIACEGQATAFTDISNINGGTINGWQWDFGIPGATSTQQNPNYSYPVAGTYTVELIVKTNNACSDTITHDVWVNPTPVMTIAGVDTCLEDVTVFENTSTPQDNTIVQWDWDFGDGSAASGISASHTYLVPGTFNVNLTATTDSGCVATGATLVKVFPNPVPSFNLVEAEGCTPHEVLFVDQSTISSTFNESFDWDFGDGNTGSGNSPVHVYPDSGYYDITLTVTSSKGCTTTLLVNDAVRANITPIADFGMSAETLSLLDATLQLTDTSQHALEWSWNLGDGTTSTDRHPFHRYTEPGTFDIILTVTNGDCQDVAFDQVTVEPIITFYIPNSFTPNNDGINETFFALGEGFETYNMKIYDRWGEMIFESNNPEIGWDGTYKGKPVEAGVYLYQFYYIDIYFDDHSYVGHVTLTR